MKYFNHARSCASLLLILCLLCGATLPVAAAALGKKGEKDYKLGLQYEAAQQWDRAAQEFALAVAADPSRGEYQLHYRRAVFNASQMFMQQGRSLAERRDYTGAYNAFRQAYGYDPVNQLALSEMERMLRLQNEKEGITPPGESGRNGAGNGNTSAPRPSPTSYQPTLGSPSPGATMVRVAASQGQNASPVLPPARVEQQRVVTFSGDLESFIRSLAERLDINVVFDRDFPKRSININLRDVTTSQVLDYIFLTQGLFFQKLNRRTILVADQVKRAQYQQLVIRTFYLQNAKLEDANQLISRVIPPQAGRPPTTVINNTATNSVTVRDTPENVRLIGDLLQSIDKDRSEVVMEVSIYEVSHTDLVQFGNQFGDPTSNSLTLGGTTSLGIIGGSREVAQRMITSPTALGAALILPQTSFNAFQRKDNTRLIYSNQIHAFDNEQSRARIGQRVPVQTAQTFPFGNFGNNTNNTTGNVNQGAGFGGGFPVFQYEETGLTLELTPQVFPNLDVQVKMNIVSKDVLNPSNPTPTFTERTINGTARIQNNRTMMLVSVAQNKQSNGRQGLPVLGGLPILGYLFAAPRRDNVQSDIVIAVTPRVLRAPAITPRDEEARPSGTLSTPTTESLEAMLQESDREDQLAAARLAPAGNALANNTQAANVQPAAAVAAKEQAVQPSSPDAESVAYVPAPKALMTSPNAAPSNTFAASSPGRMSATDAVLRNEPPPLANASMTTSRTSPSIAVNKSDVIAVPRTAVNPFLAMLPGALNVGARLKVLASEAPLLDASKFVSVAAENLAATESAPRFVIEKVPNRSGSLTGPTSAAELRLIPERQEMRIGDKRRLLLVLKTDAPLGLAVVTLRFDPHTIAIRDISPGALLVNGGTVSPSLSKSLDAANGVLLVSITPPAGATSLTGVGTLFALDIEAVGVGESAVGFDSGNTHFIASDGRNVLLQLAHSQMIVKP
ncbi:MAG: secretin N-terminal domain-containing protein [Pyrinomonadaceae bacterium]